MIRATVARRRLALLVAAVVIATPAFGHSELYSSEPRNGATLTSAPREIRLAFNERVQVTAVRLHAEPGAEIPLPARRQIVEARDEVVPLPVLRPGTYRIDWRAISADGHPVGGLIRFRIIP